MKKVIVALVLLVVAVIVVAVGSKNQTPVATVTQPSPPAAHENMHTHESAAAERVPAYYTIAPDLATLPPTLSPTLFTGNKRLAYEAAKEIPQTLAQLPCYCHCDMSSNHKSLHSCFESEHGENCGICIGEALMASSLHKRGVAVSEIRKQIIAAYGE